LTKNRINAKRKKKEETQNGNPQAEKTLEKEQTQKEIKCCGSY